MGKQFSISNNTTKQPSSDAIAYHIPSLNEPKTNETGIWSGQHIAWKLLAGRTGGKSKNASTLITERTERWSLGILC